jgi:predicted ArsR family transcriptional regulator
MRDVGLLQVHVDARGVVGRPQHRYSLSAAAPSLGLEPPSFPILARMLARAAMLAGVDAADAVEAGREQGELDGTGIAAEGRPCLDALVTELDALGFDPAVVVDDADADSQGAGVTIGFMHCPFRDLAEANPDLVCSLHRGLVEGFVGAVGGAQVSEFRSLIARDPCQVDLVVENA